MLSPSSFFFNFKHISPRHFSSLTGDQANRESFPNSFWSLCGFCISNSSFAVDGEADGILGLGYRTLTTFNETPALTVMCTSLTYASPSHPTPSSCMLSEYKRIMPCVHVCCYRRSWQPTTCLTCSAWTCAGTVISPTRPLKGISPNPSPLPRFVPSTCWTRGDLQRRQGAVIVVQVSKGARD